MTDTDNVYPFPSSESRAIKAMAAYQAGISDETAGKVKAIRAIIEYGQALLEGRNDLEKRKSNVDFKDWVHNNKLDVGEPWSNRRERTEAMAMAKIVDRTGAVNTFDACPNARPTHIMKWYRRMHEPASRKKKARSEQSSAPKPHYKAEDIAELFDKGKTNEQIAEQTGVGLRQVRHVTDRIRIEREAATKAKAKLTEEQALAAAEAKFSDKSKLKLADAIRIHKARLDRQFEATVNAEVRKRIDAADDAVRKQNAELRTENRNLKIIVQQNALFTKDEFNLLRKCLHQKGIAASSQDFDEAFNLIQTKKAKLTGQK